MKPYITFKTLIVEIIGMLMMVASLIYAVIVAATTKGKIPISYDIHGEVTKYGSPAVLIIMPVSMLFVGLIMCLILHVLPSSAWNMPVKVKEEKALIVYSDVAFMLGLIILEFGAFTLFSTLTYSCGDTVVVIGTIVLCVACAVTIIGSIVKVIHDNR